MAEYVTPEPKDILLFVNGGLGGLHALGLHSFGSSLWQTKPIASTGLAGKRTLSAIDLLLLRLLTSWSAPQGADAACAETGPGDP